KLVLINPAYEAMIDLPRNELLNQTAFDIFRAKDAELIERYDSRAIEGGASVDYHECEVETPTRGVRVRATNRMVIRDAQGHAKYLISMIEDITDRRKSEQQI